MFSSSFISNSLFVFKEIPTKEVFDKSALEASFKAIGYYSDFNDVFQKNRSGNIELKSDNIIFDIEHQTDLFGVNRIFTIDSVTTVTILNIYKLQNLFFYCKDDKGKTQYIFVEYDTLAYYRKYHPKLNANYVINIIEPINEERSWFTTIYCEKLE